MIKFAIKYYLFFFILCVVMKPLFMLFNQEIFSSMWPSLGDIIYHGMTLDRAIAAYLVLLPFLFRIVQIWSNRIFIRSAQHTYLICIALLLSIIFGADMVLYPYWGFRLDSTPFFYFLSSPADALASISWMESVMILLATIGVAGIIYGVGRYFLLLHQDDMKPSDSSMAFKWKQTGIGVLLLALMFIPIRGGFSVATLNSGTVYFSTNMKLNHAAINPCFSFLESTLHAEDFSEKYRLLPEDEMENLYAAVAPKHQAADGELFSKKRPNVVLFILESFMARAMKTTGDWDNILVNLDSLAQEGVCFTNFYANSFRTDRGIVSILSGYPSQPTTSVMKLPEKSQHLAGFPRVMADNGYDLRYFYGGDANFTNMRSYLRGQGFQNLISIEDFPISARLSKWGAFDHDVFDKAQEAILATEQSDHKDPFLYVVQSSSSHEPFEVPFHRSGLTKEMNSMAYTDSCIGVFMRKMKSKKRIWDNTVFLFVADHTMKYPRDIDNLSDLRYHIPFVMAGGALKGSRMIDTYASQMDIAATLLTQLQLPTKDLPFSHNILSPLQAHFAYFTFPDAVGVITAEGSAVFDCASNQVLRDNTDPENQWLDKAKAQLQQTYNDLHNL